MNVGELFVSIGVKGANQVVGALGGVSRSVKETAHQSLLLKASLVGAVYATQRLFSESNKIGVSLTNFAAQTQLSTKTLQQYQYAAELVGVSNEEMLGTFKQLQGVMTEAQLGKISTALGQILRLTGSTDADLGKFAKDPALFLQKLQGFATNERIPIGLRNKFLGELGIGAGVQGALFRGAFDPKILGRAPTFSSREIKGLDSANQAWVKMFKDIEMSVGRFNAANGAQIASDIGKIVNALLKLGDALTKLAKQLGLFEGLTALTSGTTDLLGGEKGGLSSATADIHGDASTVNKLKTLLNFLSYAAFGTYEHPNQEYFKNPAPAISPGVGGSTKNNTTIINQELNFQHDGRDAGKVSQTHGDAIKRAAGSMTKGQGN